MNSITFVRFGYTPYGGAENYLVRLKDQLLKQGVKVDIVSGGDFGAGTIKVSAAKFWPSWIRIPILAFKTCRLLSGNGTTVFSLERIPCADIYRAGDGVHAQWVEIKMQNEPFLKRIGTLFNPLNYVYSYMERETFQKAKAIIANSHMIKRQIVERFGVEEEKVSVVYNGVEPSKPFDKHAAKKSICAEFCVSEDSNIVLFVGSGFFRKGVARFLTIFAAIKNERKIAFIVGKENKLCTYEKLAKSLGVADKVIFTGARKDAFRFYEAADVFLFPTLYEPFSNACLEAMQKGCVTLTTTGNGVAEILPREWIISSDDSCAAFVDELFDDKPLLCELSDRASRVVQSFTIEKNATQSLSVLQKLF